MRRLSATVPHAGFVLTGVLTTLLGPILPAIETAWRLDDAQAGFLFTAQFLASLAGALLAGRLCGLWGIRATVASGYGIAAAGVLAASVPAGSVGVVGVAGWGLGTGLIVPATNLRVAEMNPSRRAAALNLLNFAWGLGAVAAPPAIAAALPRTGVRPILLALAALLAAAAAATAATGGDAPRRIAAPAGGAIWREPWIWLTGVFLFLYVGVENGIAGWMPSFAVRVLRVPEVGMAATQDGFWSAILGVRLLAPALLRRISPRTLIVGGLITGSLGTAMLAASTTAAGLVTGAVLAGAGLAGVFPTAVAGFTERAGPQAARVTGVVFALSALGGATVPWAMGALSTRLDSLRAALGLPLAGTLAMLYLELRAGGQRAGRKAKESRAL